jgi:hypothetical protein
MKNIQLNKSKFQLLLNWLLFIFQICFDALPEVQPKPFICYESKYDRKVKKLTLAVRAFNTKKQGGEAK